MVEICISCALFPIVIVLTILYWILEILGFNFNQNKNTIKEKDLDEIKDENNRKVEEELEKIKQD
jgi:hypothetical protein